MFGHLSAPFSGHLHTIACNFMMRLGDLSLIVFERRRRENLSPLCCRLVFLPIKSNQFFTNCLDSKSNYFIKEIYSIEEETMKAITKQLSINQLGMCQPTLHSHRLMHLSTSSPNFHLFLNDTNTAVLRLSLHPAQKSSSLPKRLSTWRRKSNYWDKLY